MKETSDVGMKTIIPTSAEGEIADGFYPQILLKTHFSYPSRLIVSSHAIRPKLGEGDFPRAG
jgi:hypothetical protein